MYLSPAALDAAIRLLDSVRSAVEKSWRRRERLAAGLCPAASTGTRMPPVPLRKGFGISDHLFVAFFGTCDAACASFENLPSRRLIRLARNLVALHFGVNSPRL